MKKYLVVFLIFIALLATPLNADTPQYQDWDWTNGAWIYTGIEFPPPPPPPAPSLPRVR